MCACVCTLDLAPDPLTTAADGLHHCYAERGTGGKGYYFVTKDQCQRWNFNATIGLQPCGKLNIHYNCCVIVMHSTWMSM